MLEASSSKRIQNQSSRDLNNNNNNNLRTTEGVFEDGDDNDDEVFEPLPATTGGTVKRGSFRVKFAVTPTEEEKRKKDEEDEAATVSFLLPHEERFVTNRRQKSRLRRSNRCLR